jgi:hypothetical protein
MANIPYSKVLKGPRTTRDARRPDSPRPRDHTASAAVSVSTCIYIPTRHPSEWPSPDSPGRCHIRPHPHMRISRCLGRGARACLASGAWGSRRAGRLSSSSPLLKNKIARPGSVPPSVAVSPRICYLPCAPCLCERAIAANSRAVVPVPGPMDPDPKGALLP